MNTFNIYIYMVINKGKHAIMVSGKGSSKGKGSSCT